MSGRIGPSKYISNNYSLDFDGVDDYLEISNSTIADSGQFTLSFWIKSSPATGNNIFNVLFSSEPYYNLNRFWVMSGANIQWVNINNVPKNIAVGVLDNTWHHIMIIWNPDGANSTIRSYIDGANEANAVTDYRYAPDWNGGAYQGPINFIGGNNIAGYKGVIGTIDEFAAFEGDRSADLASIYNKGVPANLNKLPVPPLQWFRMGDNGVYKDPQWLIPSNENKNKVSNYSTAFDGTDDYLNITNNTTLGRTQNISYSVWVNLVSTTTRQYIVGNWTSSNFGTGLALESIGGNALVFQIGDGTNDSFFNSRVSNFSTLVPPNTWAHILATWDGTDAKIYINGNLENTWSPTTPYAIIGWNSFWVGRRADSAGSNIVSGLLNEFSLFDTDISISDVWDGSGKPIDASGIMGITNYWRLGKEATYSSGTSQWTIPDEVGTNDGTSNNLMADSARVGEAPGSVNNALSFNMDLIDRVEDTPATP